jgi:hypothetical protein
MIKKRQPAKAARDAFIRLPNVASILRSDTPLRAIRRLAAGASRGACMATNALAGAAALVPPGSVSGAGASAPNPGGSSALKRFESAMDSARAALNVEGFGALKPGKSGVSDLLGFDRLTTMGKQLSQADRESFRGVERLMRLDPTDPALPAELLGASLTAAKSSISTTVAMKFSSKVSEGLTTLLKNG